MRVYVPSTFVGLSRAEASGTLSTSGHRAVVLPPDAADPETAEYTALQVAADASLEALRGEPEAVRRRAVVVANVPDNWADLQSDGRAILLRNLPMDRVIAVYADAPDSADLVVRALNQDTVGLDETALLWFGRQELPQLVG